MFDAMPEITDHEFEKFRQYIFDAAGISVPANKKVLIKSRLMRRLTHYNLSSFDAYHALITGAEQPQEHQMVIDLLTTNETYFFREQKHFDFLKNRILPQHGRKPFRFWSAACSTGEEPYSVAMMLADQLGSVPWQIQATDISRRVLDTAKKGLYPVQEGDKLPAGYLVKYCLKGVRKQAGTMLIDKVLRERIDFKLLNLHGPWPASELFDLIFLRNVMIYFDKPTKEKLVRRLSQQLRPGGYLIIGHSESLTSIKADLISVQASVYQKPT